MTNDTLGRLVSIDPRRVWATEAGDFTPWLAQESNLALLSDTIGLELELRATEQHVGPFRADIVCNDTASGNLVLIENQLERTDHTHLGQILTYAAGLNAVTVVWIARKFIDEHRAALDWLNDNTPPSINFFGLEVELWRIGESGIAPKFNVACKPNDWIKSPGDMTVTKAWQLEYWTALMAYISEHSRCIKPRRPQPQHWMTFAVGRSDFSLVSVVRSKKREVEVSLELTGDRAKSRYFSLLNDKSGIESEIGVPLTWLELPERKASYIACYLHDVDPENVVDRSRQYEWLLRMLEAFHRCFAPRIQGLNGYSQPHQMSTDPA